MNNRTDSEPVTAQYVFFPEPFQVQIGEKDAGALAEGEILVKNLYTCISAGTEMALYEGTHIAIPDPRNKFAKYPFRPGYCAVGRIIRSNNNAWQENDTVITRAPHQSVVKLNPLTKDVVRLPESTNLMRQTFSPLACIAQTALYQCPVRKGSVLVVGLGLIGNMASQLFQLNNYEVYATDLIDKRVAAAKACGIASCGTGIPGKTFDVVVEATGSPMALNLCLSHAAEFGSVIALGSTRGKVEIDVYNHIHRIGASLIGAHENALGRRPGDEVKTRSYLETMVERIDKGKLVIDPLISAVISFIDAAAAYQNIAKKKDKFIGIVLDWGKNQV